MSNALESINVLTERLAADTTAVQKRNFARSAETMAEINAPGFRDYLSKASETKTASSSPAVMGPNANLQGPAMDYEDSNFTLADVGDVLNPLQHIPVIGTIYRHFTGDIPKSSTQAIGDMIYGGAVGGLASMGLALVNALSSGTSESGKPVDMQIAEAVFGPGANDQDTVSAPTAFADATPSVIAPATSTPVSTTTVTEKPATPAPTTQPSEAKTVLAPATLASAISKNPLRTASTSSDANKPAQFFPIKRESAAGIKISGAARPTEEVTVTAKAVAAPSTEEASTPTSPKTKQAYGGVVDPLMYQRAESLKGSGTLTMGSTIYSKERFGMHNAYSAARDNPTAEKKTVSTNAESPSYNKPTDSASLGRLMHDSAHQAQTATQATGVHNILPPELVQDMMTMALEKYSASNAPGID